MTEDVAGRAVRGASLLVARSFGLRLFTIAGTIALARLLDPADFGAYAVALAAQQMGRAVVEFGLSAALVRQPAAPGEAQQSAVAGVALAIAFGITFVVGLAALTVVLISADPPEIVALVAIAALALPAYAARLVPTALLERGLTYGKLVAIEIAEVAAYYGFAVPAAVAGLGAYSLAAAVPVAAVAGMVAAFLLQPWARRMRLDLQAVRPLVRFGALTSAMPPLQFGWQLAFVSILIAVGGQALAGFYSLAERLLSLPVAMFAAVSRVALPAFSRLPQGPERQRLVAQAIRASAVVVSLPLALITGAADPLIAVIFGQRWLPAADVVVTVAAGVLVASCAGAVLLGAAFAEGNARTPLTAAVIQAGVVVGAAAPLASAFGEAGAGLTAALGSLAFTVVLVVRAPPGSRAGVPAVCRALAIATIAAVVGDLVSSGTGVGALLLAVTASGVVWLVLYALAGSRDLALVLRLLRRHLRRPQALVSSPTQ